MRPPTVPAPAAAARAATTAARTAAAAAAAAAAATACVVLCRWHVNSRHRHLALVLPQDFVKPGSNVTDPFGNKIKYVELGYPGECMQGRLFSSCTFCAGGSGVRRVGVGPWHRHLPFGTAGRVVLLPEGPPPLPHRDLAHLPCFKNSCAELRRLPCRVSPRKRPAPPPPPRCLHQQNMQALTPCPSPRATMPS